MGDRKEYQRLYYLANKEYFRQYNASHPRKKQSETEERKQARRKAQNKWSAKKRKESPQFKLTQNLRNRMKNALKWGSKGGSAVADLGLSIPEYRVYLESKFVESMSWENYGRGKDKWSIDHIVPLSSFDLTDRDQFLKACHYTNTQPMWFTDNISKGTKCNL